LTKAFFVFKVPKGTYACQQKQYTPGNSEVVNEWLTCHEQDSKAKKDIPLSWFSSTLIELKLTTGLNWMQLDHFNAFFSKQEQTKVKGEN